MQIRIKFYFSAPKKLQRRFFIENNNFSPNGDYSRKDCVIECKNQSERLK